MINEYELHTTLTPNTMKYWLMFNEEIYRQRHTRLGGQNSNKRITTTGKYKYPFPLLFSKGITEIGDFL